ncbi:hypothetical protein [Gilliamella bombi]|uniref:hypothetical protein n=1 Tax=Gilliamella bombi TaxID=1908521 RepID=UPI000A15A09C|nr:hypothetical protein [Gilliamella bombi]
MIHYHFRYQQTYVLNLLNNLIRRVFTRNLFISSKLSKTVLLVLALLLLSSSWNVQANGKKARASNRSDVIMLQPSPAINYVRPTLLYGKNINSWPYAGPADIWNPDKGFSVQSIDPDLYYLNFPTTGMEGLYFDLLITDIRPEELKWKPVEEGGIRVTVTNVRANKWWLPDEDRGQIVARVELSNPSRQLRLPARIELVGRDINTDDEVVKYGFVLQKWFGKSDGRGTYENQLNYCRWNALLGSGYRMAKLRELTNAKCGVINFFPCINGIDNKFASSPSGFNYQRRIGEGFLAEWGPIEEYYNDWFDYVWVSEAAEPSFGGREEQFIVSARTGGVGTKEKSKWTAISGVICIHY